MPTILEDVTFGSRNYGMSISGALAYGITHPTANLYFFIYIEFFSPTYLNRPRDRSTAMLIGVNLTRNGRLETASTQTKATDPGFQNLDLSLVRRGGQCQCSREFHSPGQK
ncbi:hypothetical protein [uncultured Nostoc sp.]|uniref:hypothetical protein n=1 Tax=uncultured Nostoc sp. TaxID=340711 RepID=UPI0035CA1983